MNLVDEVILFARDFINVKSFRTSTRKSKVREAYEKVTGKKIVVTCSTCYVEAITEIVKLAKMTTRKGYELKKGVLLQAFGDASKTCTNDTLTDELAEWYLRHYPEKEVLFSRIPGAPQKPHVPEGITVVPPPVPDAPPSIPLDEKPEVPDSPNDDLALEKKVTIRPKRKSRAKKKASD